MSDISGQPTYKAESSAIGIEKEKIAFKKDAAKAKDGNGEDIDTVNKELKAHWQDAETEQALKRYKANGATVEELGELLRDYPAGIPVHRKELMGLISTWDKEDRVGNCAFSPEGGNGNASFDKGSHWARRDFRSKPVPVGVWRDLARQTHIQPARP